MSQSSHESLEDIETEETVVETVDRPLSLPIVTQLTLKRLDIMNRPYKD